MVVFDFVWAGTQIKHGFEEELYQPIEAQKVILCLWWSCDNMQVLGRY